MKRLLLFLLAVVLAGVSAMAEDYPIKVLDIQVTSDNASSITGPGISALDPKKESRLWYDSENNCLMMDNILLESTNPLSTGVRFEDEGGSLEIKTISSSRINTQYGIESEGDICLNNDGYVVLYIEASTGIMCKGRLSIKGMCDIKAVSSAINGDGCGTLDLSGVMEFDAASEYSAVIWNLSDYIILPGPEDYEYERFSGFSDTGDGYGVAARDEDGNAIVGSDITVMIKMYIRVGDFVVTALNIGEQPFSHPSITGSVTYDKEAGVLTLENASITSTLVNEAIAYNPGMLSQIVLKGDNIILWGDFEDKIVMECCNDILITGGGSLTAKEGIFYVKGKEKPKIQISDVTMSVKEILSEYEGTIELKNCSLKDCFIDNLGKMEISDCTIDGGPLINFVNEETGTLVMSNCTLNKLSVLWSDGTTELTDCTLNELTTINIYKGTMTLNNCTWTNGNILFNNGGILDIKNSTVELSNISLDLEGSAIVNQKGTINISENSTISAYGLYWGYNGHAKSSLTIDNSAVRLKANYSMYGSGDDKIPSGAATGCNLTLTDVELYSDDGEMINDGEDGYFEILRYGERATDWVEIGYPRYFKIGDLEVTSQNLDAQPYSDPSIEGTVTFDKETGVLTFEGVTVTTESIGLNLFKGKVSQIVLNGENTITSESDMIYNRSALTINGDGTLMGNNVINNDDSYAYLNLDGCNIVCGGFANDGSLNISNSQIVVAGRFSNWSASNVNINSSTLTIEGKNEDGIYNDGTIYIGSNSQVDAMGFEYGYNSEETTSSLTIDNSTLRLNSGDGILVGKGYNLNCWTDVELETAGGATLYEGKDEYFEVRRIGSPSDWVVFTVPADKKKYNLSVGGVDVTGLNCSDIKGDNITGKVSYDPVARRLTLTDAAIGEGGVAMGYGLGTTELMLEGSNIITGIDPMSASLSASDPVNITSADGKGSLTINNEEEWGTGLMLGSGGSISNCIIDVTCKNNAINGQATLTITGGYVTAEGGNASISGFSNLLLGDDTQITSPEGAYYNNEGWPCQLEVGGSVVTEQVVIRYLKNYGIKVGSMWITSDNYMAIKPAELKNGKVSFDPEKSELLLSRARLEEKGIDVMGVFDPLTIVLEGENTIDVAGKPLNLMSKTDIKAKTSILSDSLIIFTDLYGINFQKDLTISDVNLRIDAERAAFLGMGSPKLTLERSSVEATGWDDGVMTDVGDFILGERIKYVSPKDAAFDKETGTLVSGGELLKQTTIKWFMPGDANNDYLVDISDVRAIANNIWEVEDMAFEPYNADLNVDGEVNVTDIVYVVDIILDKPATARGKSVAALARRAAETSADRLSLASRNGLLTAALTNAEGYYGLQMDLRLSEGQTLDDIALCGTCADSHVVAWRQTDEENVYRVVVYALQPAALIGGSSQLLTFAIEGEGTVEASDILAVTTDGTRCLLAPASGNVATGITEAVATERVATGTYDLNGRRVSEEGGLKKGIYIRNGKKLIIK